MCFVCWPGLIYCQELGPRSTGVTVTTFGGQPSPNCAQQAPSFHRLPQAASVWGAAQCGVATFPERCVHGAWSPGCVQGPPSPWVQNRLSISPDSPHPPTHHPPPTTTATAATRPARVCEQDSGGGVPSLHPRPETVTEAGQSTAAAPGTRRRRPASGRGPGQSS